MDKRIIITGATGFIGKNLAFYLNEAGYKVVAFTRDTLKSAKILPYAQEHVYWDLSRPETWQGYIEGSYAVINLAGAPISAKRWSEDYKSTLINSRIKGTTALSEAIVNAKIPPSVFISVSAIGYYGNTLDNLINETSKNGNDFLAQLCNDWENAALKAKSKTRVVLPRMGIVLDSGEGALAKMLTPFDFYLGGPLGSGRQWMSWIHILDVVNAFKFCLEESGIDGVVNFVSPNPVIMNDFSKAIGMALKKPSSFRVPSWLLKVLFGEMSQVILEGQRVEPVKLLSSGYNFSFTDPFLAISDVIEHSII